MSDTGQIFPIPSKSTNQLHPWNMEEPTVGSTSHQGHESEDTNYENVFIGPFGKKRRILFEQMQKMALQASSSNTDEAVPNSVQTAPRHFNNEPIKAPPKLSRTNFRCEQCNKEFTQRRNYEYHKSKHDGTMQFAGTCPICTKTFSNKDYLSSHMKIHCNSREYKCEWCWKSFNQRTAYNMHIRIHTGYKPHVCEICTKAFSRKGILRLHLKTHLDKRVYFCRTCAKAFTNESNLKRHENVHGEYSCHICAKNFAKAHQLRTHMREHGKVGQAGGHLCPNCGASFQSTARFRTHSKKCIKDQSMEMVKPELDQRPSSSRLPPATMVPMKTPMSRPTVIRTAGPRGAVPPPATIPGMLKYPYVGIMHMPSSTPNEPDVKGGQRPKKRDIRMEEHCE